VPRERRPRLTPPAQSFFLGPAGKGAEMKLVVNMMMGSMMATCECRI
jgi:3-hydroxyisobutyrate dehydrogenase-like beta-hydroxyacid dehydrogenase